MAGSFLDLDNADVIVTEKMARQVQQQVNAYLPKPANSARMGEAMIFLPQRSTLLAGANGSDSGAFTNNRFTFDDFTTTDGNSLKAPAGVNKVMAFVDGVFKTLANDDNDDGADFSVELDQGRDAVVPTTEHPTVASTITFNQNISAEAVISIVIF